MVGVCAPPGCSVEEGPSSRLRVVKAAIYDGSTLYECRKLRGLRVIVHLSLRDYMKPRDGAVDPVKTRGAVFGSVGMRLAG